MPKDTTRANPGPPAFSRWEKARVLKRFAQDPIRGFAKERLHRVGREATHDTNGTAGQTVDVVPNGPDQMDESVAGQQSLQSWSLEPAEERAIPDFLPTNPLAVPGEVFQMLGLRMHDVEVG